MASEQTSLRESLTQTHRCRFAFNEGNYVPAMMGDLGMNLIAVIKEECKFL